MSNNGFGFSPNDPEDSDNNDDNNQDNNRNDGSGDSSNPFEFLFGGADSPLGNLFNGGNFGSQGNDSDDQGPFAFGVNSNGGASFGSLGDMINQFGTMISGFVDESSKTGLNTSMVRKIALQDIGRIPRPTPHDDKAVADSVKLVDHWLNDTTSLPAGAKASQAFSQPQWVEETMPVWERIIGPLASQLSEAALGNLPEEAREEAGPMLGIVRQVNNMNFSMQMGHALAALAKDTSQLSEWGFPLVHCAEAGISTDRLDQLTSTLGAGQREVLIYLAAREAAHQRLFQHVPWLAEMLLLSIEDYASGLSLDFSGLEEATRNFDPEMLQNPEFLSNPEAMQEMMGSINPDDLRPKVQSSHQNGRVRVETLLSLVEGWVDVVVGNALVDRIPETTTINAAWSSYRANPESAMSKIDDAVGLSLRAPYADQAADLWQRIGTAVGIEKRDQVWDHVDFLPTLEDIEHPAGFIDSLISGNTDKDFDPIAEIMRLEREENDDEDGQDSGDSEDTDPQS